MAFSEKTYTKNILLIIQVYSVPAVCLSFNSKMMLMKTISQPRREFISSNSFGIHFLRGFSLPWIFS